MPLRSLSLTGFSEYCSHSFIIISKLGLLSIEQFDPATRATNELNAWVLADNARIREAPTDTEDDQDIAQQAVFAQITAEERALVQGRAQPASATAASMNASDQEMADADLLNGIAENPLEEYYAREPASPLGTLAAETASRLVGEAAGGPPEDKGPVAKPTE